jgi:hypothetical protein
MTNIIQHVIINKQDEMVILNGVKLIVSDPKEVSALIESLRGTFESKVIVEKVKFERIIKGERLSASNLDIVIAMIPSHLKYIDDESDNSYIELLRGIIHDVNATGGLIEFNDGNVAPKADPSWTDLGDRITKISTYLDNRNSGIKLKTEKVDFTASESFEHF